MDLTEEDDEPVRVGLKDSEETSKDSSNVQEETAEHLGDKTQTVESSSDTDVSDAEANTRIIMNVLKNVGPVKTGKENLATTSGTSLDDGKSLRTSPSDGISRKSRQGRGDKSVSKHKQRQGSERRSSEDIDYMEDIEDSGAEPEPEDEDAALFSVALFCGEEQKPVYVGSDEDSEDALDYDRIDSRDPNRGRAHSKSSQKSSNSSHRHKSSHKHKSKKDSYSESSGRHKSGYRHKSPKRDSYSSSSGKHKSRHGHDSRRESSGNRSAHLSGYYGHDSKRDSYSESSGRHRSRRDSHNS